MRLDHLLSKELTIIGCPLPPRVLVGGLLMGGISMNYRSWSVHCLGVGVVVGFGAVGGAAGEYAVGFRCGGLWLEGWWWCLWYWVVAHCWVLRQQACCACRWVGVVFLVFRLKDHVCFPVSLARVPACVGVWCGGVGLLFGNCIVNASILK